ncbi:MAG: XdhC family protein [Pseudomonadota bacterium]
MDPNTLLRLNEARRSRTAAVVVTELSSGRDRLVVEGDTVSGELGEAIRAAMLGGKSGTVEIKGEEVFLNAYLPPPRIVVIGAVHISQALAVLARTTGYALEVIDPRTAFATTERFGDTSLFADWPDEVLGQRPLDRYCALAAVTHDPKIDDYPLRAALEAGCFYVGALGSRKTHAKRLDRLKDLGVAQDKLASIRSPIGLDIGAEGPQEIAVAIMAEIVLAFRRRGLAQGK